MPRPSQIAHQSSLRKISRQEEVEEAAGAVGEEKCREGVAGCAAWSVMAGLQRGGIGNEIEYSFRSMARYGDKKEYYSKSRQDDSIRIPRSGMGLARTGETWTNRARA